MASTPQSQARRGLRAVAREGAHYISSLPVYEDEPYASLESAAYHYGREHRDDLYMEEYIAVDAARRTATLAVRRVADGGYLRRPRPGSRARRPAVGSGGHHACRVTGQPPPVGYGPERHRPGVRHARHYMRGLLS